MEKSEYEVRKERLAKLREQGEAYPVDTERTALVGEIAEKFDAAFESQERFTIAGRAMTARRIGALTFVRLRDESGEMQMVMRKEDLGEEYETWSSLFDTGDILEVAGTAYVTKTGERSLLASRVRTLAKAIRPLPEKWHGLQDIEVRYRQRELDLLANPAVRERFVMRSKLTSAFRRFLDDRGFLEVETPMLQSIPGGANARPFITHHNALDIDLYLRIAPELYLKRLLVGGFEKIYEIGRCFRNEGIDYAHNPEFTMMEMYWAYVSGEKYIAFLEEMLRYALHAARGENLRVVIEGREVDFAAPWKRTTFYDAISEASGIDVKSLSTPQELIKEVKAKKIKADFSGCHGMGEYLDALYKATARPQMTEPTWVYDYPLDLKPLARQHTQEKQLSASVQLVVCGAEIINAYYHELNDPEDQKNRFLAQQELREKGSEEAQWMDEDFIAALELGMPPAAGMGVGIDRLAAMITESPNLKEVILFPTLRPKQ
jgi:lysyl-tRNA synthetase class 2